MIRILIVDDHQLIRRGLGLILDPVDDIEVVATCASSAEALVALDNHPIDVVLADAVMPGIGGPELVRRIRAARPATPAIMLTAFDDPGIVDDALSAGASGFLFKDCAPEALASAIRHVHAGGMVLDPRVTAHLDRDTGSDDLFSGLTPMERRVARLVGEGMSNPEIGAVLHLATGTVKNHVSALLRKTGEPDRVRLALRFHDGGPRRR